MRRRRGLARCMVLVDGAESGLGHAESGATSGGVIEELNLDPAVDAAGLRAAGRYWRHLAFRAELEVPPLPDTAALRQLVRAAGLRGYAAGLEAAWRYERTGRFSAQAAEE